MEEIVVEGLTHDNFLVLEQVLKTYKVSVIDEITYEDLLAVYTKVKQIVDYLET